MEMSYGAMHEIGVERHIILVTKYKRLTMCIYIYIYIWKDLGVFHYIVVIVWLSYYAIVAMDELLHACWVLLLCLGFVLYV
jgi:hypothetical protein